MGILDIVPVRVSIVDLIGLDVEHRFSGWRPHRRKCSKTIRLRKGEQGASFLLNISQFW